MQAPETMTESGEKPKKRAKRKHHDHARDGISIEDVWKTCERRSGKRFLARVRDPRTKSYIRQMFDKLSHAEGWAAQERARVTLGQSGAGTWPIETVVADYLVAQKSASRSPHLIRLIERVRDDLVEHGITHLEDGALCSKVRRWLEHPTLSKTPRRDGKQVVARNTLRSRFMRLRGLVRHAHLHLGLSRDPLEGFSHPLLKVEGHAREAETFSVAEMRAILALNATADPAWRAFVIAIYTGGRKGDLEKATWQHFDLDQRVWAIPLGKHGRRREVPIQDELADFIAAMRPTKRDDWGNKVVIVPRLRIQHMRSLAEKAKVVWDRGDDAPTGLPRRLGWHSARHTAASLLSACGVDGVALQLALGHHSRDLTVHYAKARAQYGRDIENEKWPRGAVCLIKPPVPQAAKPTAAKPDKPAVK
jgi:integrase